MTTHARGLAAIKALAGQDLGHTGWWEITQDRVDKFADATDDHQWIHIDPQRAADGPFKTTIAHGYLTLSLLSALSSELLVIEGVGMSINYGLDRVRFPAPVPVGSKIRLAGTVVSVDDVRDNGVQMVQDLTVEIDGSDKPACVARWLSRHYA
ncbi:MaoC family dehydratase [Kibdelosporangium aridum]|uniref:Acyl dehydratase n=1 Tax=Kibdelosporangium aridum TaxID=2030 RepID=A0A1Y5XVD9_KIBAR|nr:MaoC family dehydratase [Kibdelosporangium aridum]SMD18982.1 Acyl dehydratase [Kibdelosporangium aridum]